MFKGFVEPLYQPISLGVVYGGFDLFYLQLPAGLFHNRRHEARTLVSKDLVGDPHPAEELDQFSGDGL